MDCITILLIVNLHSSSGTLEKKDNHTEYGYLSPPDLALLIAAFTSETDNFFNML